MMALKLSIIIKKLLVSLILFQHFSDVKSSYEITVMVSQTESFSFYDSNKQSWNGLDIEIVENFAKKINATIKYIVSNESLNGIFSFEDRIKIFLADS